ncbi:YfhH family protein [Virgibacillus sp. MSJ-26]|uniref:YfhH family protein n=1 Tax=Virgibacillus sp. MSJ-26 TaxID=2841522 RepID=UPI001C10B207|nr:YfhH family protein [Virgibacillus sp. MSJ-26]MBU5468147.1 YfhH family protein [Virgibacillus sp. MSJ-26]
MNNYRYSDYTVEQLRAEVGKLKEKAQKAEQLGNISEVAVNERKMQVAMAYMLNPDEFQADKVYELPSDPGHRFKVNYINGVFAWGHRINLLDEVYEKEEAIPISLLGNTVKE